MDGGISRAELLIHRVSTDVTLSLTNVRRVQRSPDEEMERGGYYVRGVHFLVSVVFRGTQSFGWLEDVSSYSRRLYVKYL